MIIFYKNQPTASSRHHPTVFDSLLRIQSGATPPNSWMSQSLDFRPPGTMKENPDQQPLITETFMSIISSSSTMVLLVGATILVLVFTMLCVSLLVHLHYAKKRRVRQLLFSSRTLWRIGPGYGEAQSRNLHYTFKQSKSMAKGVSYLFQYATF